MPEMQRVNLDIGDLTLTGSGRQPVPLAQLVGVNVLVMMRHRH